MKIRKVLTYIDRFPHTENSFHFIPNDWASAYCLVIGEDEKIYRGYKQQGEEDSWKWTCILSEIKELN